MARAPAGLVDPQPSRGVSQNKGPPTKNTRIPITINYKDLKKVPVLGFGIRKPHIDPVAVVRPEDSQESAKRLTVKGLGFSLL